MGNMHSILSADAGARCRVISRCQVVIWCRIIAGSCGRPHISSGSRQHLRAAGPTTLQALATAAVWVRAEEAPLAMGRLSGVAAPPANATSMSRRLQLDWAIRWQHNLSVVAGSSHQRMWAGRKCACGRCTSRLHLEC